MLLHKLVHPAGMANMDTINDSWITGGICSGGPPFAFDIEGRDSGSSALRDLVEAGDEYVSISVAENGGSIRNG